jgi:hypothetical protein
MNANKREWGRGISNQSLHTANLWFETNSCELASISGLFDCHKTNSSLFWSDIRSSSGFVFARNEENACPAMAVKYNGKGI